MEWKVPMISMKVSKYKKQAYYGPSIHPTIPVENTRRVT